MTDRPAAPRRPAAARPAPPGRTAARRDPDGSAPVAVACARAGIYRLLGRLYLEEVDGPLIALVRRAPPFADVLDEAPEGELITGLRSEYARLLLLNVYPYESVYVDPSAMLNTQVSLAVEEVYAAAGFEPAGRPRLGAPDHIGAELTFMAELAEREALALARGGPAGSARHWEAWQRRFLAEHLGYFGPVFALAAARDARHPFYRTLAGVTAEFLAEDLNRLGALPSSPSPHEPAGAPAGPAGDMAALELAEVARHLATPALAGFHLSREALYRIAGRLRLPLAMVERVKTVEVLLEGAARYGHLATLLDLLGAAAGDAAGGYEALAVGRPGAAQVLLPWRRRAAATGAGLAAMRRAAGEDGRTPPVTGPRQGS